MNPSSVTNWTLHSLWKKKHDKEMTCSWTTSWITTSDRLPQFRPTLLHKKCHTNRVFPAFYRPIKLTNLDTETACTKQKANYLPTFIGNSRFSATVSFAAFLFFRFSVFILSILVLRRWFVSNKSHQNLQTTSFLKRLQDAVLWIHEY